VYLLFNSLERTPVPFSECVFRWLLELLKKEVPEQSRHLVQYFQVFLSYASKGPREVSQPLYSNE